MDFQNATNEIIKIRRSYNLVSHNFPAVEFDGLNNC